MNNLQKSLVWNHEQGEREPDRANPRSETARTTPPQVSNRASVVAILTVAGVVVCTLGVLLLRPGAQHPQPKAAAIVTTPAITPIGLVASPTALPAAAATVPAAVQGTCTWTYSGGTLQQEVCNQSH